MICALLILQTPTLPTSLDLISPWLDMLTRDVEVGARRPSTRQTQPAFHQDPHTPVRRPAARLARHVRLPSGRDPARTVFCSWDNHLGEHGT